MSRSPVTCTSLPSVADAKRRQVMIILCVITAFLYWVALYLYVPTLPIYVQNKSGSLALVGVVLAMYGLGHLIMRFPVGIAADWLGWRKPFIIVGLTLAGLGAWTMGIAQNVNGLIVGRAITGLAACAWVPLVAMFCNLFPLHEAVRAIAILTLVGSLARMLASGATGSLNEVGGYPLAFFLAASTAVLAILVTLPTREKRRQPRRPSLSGISSLITRRDVLLPSLLSAISQHAEWSITFGFLPLLAGGLGATHVAQSLLLTMHFGVFTFGSFVSTAVSRRIGARRLECLGFTLLSVGIGGASFAPSLTPIFVSQFCIGLAQGIIHPVLMGMSIQYVADSERTTAIGMHQAVYAIGMFSGPWLSGTLANTIGIRSMFRITALACLALSLFVSHTLLENPLGIGPHRP